MFALNKKIIFNPVQGRRHRGGRGGHSLRTFFAGNRKKGNKGKKGRVSKQKLLKGCHQDQNVNVLAILERLGFKIFLVDRQYFSVFHSPSTLKSISPARW